MLLREKDRKRLIDIFEKITVPVEVWAYGSRVNGGAHDGSDLDLVLRTATLEPLPMRDFSEIYNEIKDSNIPILVELRDWARLPTYFHPNIEKSHEVLFSSFEAMQNA